MPELIALAGLALVDCINPSAIVATLYLLSAANPGRKIVTYVAGVFTAYLTFGVLLMLGLDALFTRWSDFFWSPTAYAVQGIVGLLMLVYSFLADAKPKTNRLERLSGVTGLAAIFVLGMAITVAELTTALPHLAAVGILTSMDAPFVLRLAILMAYNLIFISPPLLLYGAYALFSRRLEERFDSLKERMQRAGRETALWIIGIVGFFVTFDALAYFDFFGLIPFELPDGLRSPSEAWLREWSKEP